MNTYLETRWGGGPENPSKEEMLNALAELDTPDEEHPDCWLTDENGWTIGAHESGKIVLENVEGDEGPWHIPKGDRGLVMTLWFLLQAGDLSAIRSYPWKDGYN
jgi:hypothetical protein